MIEFFVELVEFKKKRRKNKHTCLGFILIDISEAPA